MKQTKHFKYIILLIFLSLVFSSILTAQNQGGIIAYVDYYKLIGKTHKGRNIGKQIEQARKPIVAQMNKIEADREKIMDDYYQRLVSNQVTQQQKVDYQRWHEEHAKYIKQVLSQNENYINGLRKELDTEFNLILNQVITEMSSEMNLAGVYYFLEQIPAGVQYFDMTDTVAKAMNTFR